VGESFSFLEVFSSLLISQGRTKHSPLTKKTNNRVKKQDQHKQPQQPSRAALEKREQMAAAAEARLKAASARQQLW
jgi:hypothetical protein